MITADTLPGGKHWSMVMWRNSRLKLTDVDGGANVGMLFYNPLNLLERYNAPDTLKCQHTFKLTRGHCLYSDMGRIFCSIVADSFGWHDTVCGNTTKATVARKWGETNYQKERNDWLQNGHDSFLVEAGQIRAWPARSRRQRQLVQQGRGGRRRRPVTRCQRGEAGRLGRPPLRDGHAGAVAHLPASAEYDASYPRKPVRFEISEAASRPPTIPPDFRRRRTGAASRTTASSTSVLRGRPP